MRERLLGRVGREQQKCSELAVLLIVNETRFVGAKWLDVDLTDLAKHMLKVYISDLVAHVFKTACLGIFSEIDGMVAYCHGAARLAVCC